MKGYKNTGQLVPESGAAIETKDRWDRTPLSHAAEVGHWIVAKVLLDRDAAMKTVTIGNEPHSHALQRWDMRVIKLLLERGGESAADGPFMRFDVPGTEQSDSKRPRVYFLLRPTARGRQRLHLVQGPLHERHRLGRCMPVLVQAHTGRACDRAMAGLDIALYGSDG
ncbi:predicted protein [Aspergillus terreus NIH2624]|uniref:Uncharacterized protein n=1 Tax=Aspergillus terreus (strain NIH 2624 / FGSC A1156) TaxID=341663 RepID=Q0CJ38_ASPTN|nr:uncharacterized protein ATEG_06296 [Aspergillus terreus NIH2624]EAU32840.1 predicted protein [Aspergillus terreus NIH2624]